MRSELTPDQKILVVLSERKNGPVMMIGDGVNDAPALAAADVGVAMGAKGAAASAEAADVVLLVDQLDRILPAIRIARRSRFIALESVVAGIGLSTMAMIAAAFGLLVPVEGALLQEADRRGGYLQRAARLARVNHAAAADPAMAVRRHLIASMSAGDLVLQFQSDQRKQRGKELNDAIPTGPHS